MTTKGKAVKLGGAATAARKKELFERLISLFETHSEVLFITIDNVGSDDLQKMRARLRGKATIMLGKNTMFRTCLKQRLTQEPPIPGLADVIDAIEGNMGFCFVKTSTDEVSSILKELQIPSYAKTGMFSQCDYVLPAGNTGLGTNETNTFQALKIATKITKGMIETKTDTQVLTKGMRVSAGAALLMQVLGVRPFVFTINMQKLLSDGSLLDAAVLDMTDESILAGMMDGIQNVAALSRESGIPSYASIPHSIADAFKNCAAVALAANCEMPQIEKIRAAISA